jgi:glycerol-3-phosphate dehydrogenase
VRHYGWDASLILDEITRRPDWGLPLFEGLPYCLAELAYLCRTEGVCHLIDLVKRRTPLYFLADGAGTKALPRIAKHVARVLGWSNERQADELSAVASEFQSDMQACTDVGPLLPERSQETVCA